MIYKFNKKHLVLAIVGYLFICPLISCSIHAFLDKGELIGEAKVISTLVCDKHVCFRKVEKDGVEYSASTRSRKRLNEPTCFLVKYEGITLFYYGDYGCENG